MDYVGEQAGPAKLDNTGGNHSMLDVNGSQSDDEDYYYDVYQYDYTTFPEYRATNIMYVYMSPVLLLVGTVGNLLSVFVMLRLSRNVLSTCTYLSLLSVMDLLILYTRCGNEWLIHIANKDLSSDLMLHSDSICKVYPFVFSFIFCMSKWVIVAVSVDAFITTRWPGNVADWCTIDRARAVIFVLTVILVCINIHYFWTFDLVDLKQQDSGQEGFYCTFAKHGYQYSQQFQEVIWPMINMLVADVLPFIIVIVLCAYISCKMCTMNGKMAQFNNVKDPAGVLELRTTIVILSVCFVVLTLPKFVFVIFKYVTDKYNLLVPTVKLMTQKDLAKATCDILEYCFFSCKIVLYLSTSRRFRHQLVKMLRCCCCSAPKNRKTYPHGNRYYHDMSRPLTRPYRWQHNHYQETTVDH